MTSVYNVTYEQMWVETSQHSTSIAVAKLLVYRAKGHPLLPKFKSYPKNLF